MDSDDHFIPSPLEEMATTIDAQGRTVLVGLSFEESEEYRSLRPVLIKHLTEIKCSLRRYRALEKKHYSQYATILLALVERDMATGEKGVLAIN